MEVDGVEESWNLVDKSNAKKHTPPKKGKKNSQSSQFEDVTDLELPSYSQLPTGNRRKTQVDFDLPIGADSVLEEEEEEEERRKAWRKKEAEIKRKEQQIKEQWEAIGKEKEAMRRKKENDNGRGDKREKEREQNVRRDSETGMEGAEGGLKSLRDIQLETLARSRMIEARPKREEEKFGDDGRINYQAFKNRFRSVTRVEGMNPLDALAEILYWLKAHGW